MATNLYTHLNSASACDRSSFPLDRLTYYDRASTEKLAHPTAYSSSSVPDYIDFDDVRPLQLVHTEYHLPTRRLSGSVMVNPDFFQTIMTSKVPQANSQLNIRVFVRMSVNGGESFTDHDAQPLFAGHSSAEGAYGMDLYGFSISLSTAHRVTRTLQRRVSTASVSSNSSTERTSLSRHPSRSTLQYLIVAQTEDGSQYIDDNDGSFYSIRTHISSPITSTVF